LSFVYFSLMVCVEGGTVSCVLSLNPGLPVLAGPASGAVADHTPALQHACHRLPAMTT